MDKKEFNTYVSELYGDKVRVASLETMSKENLDSLNEYARQQHLESMTH